MGNHKSQAVIGPCVLFGAHCEVCEFRRDCEHGHVDFAVLATILSLLSNEPMSYYRLWKLAEQKRRKPVYYQALKRHVQVCTKLGLVETTSKPWQGGRRSARFATISERGRRLLELLSEHSSDNTSAIRSGIRAS